MDTNRRIQCSISKIEIRLTRQESISINRAGGHPAMRSPLATAFTVSSLAAVPVAAVFVSDPVPAPIVAVPVGAISVSLPAVVPVAAVPAAAVSVAAPVAVPFPLVVSMSSCFPF